MNSDPERIRQLPLGSPSDLRESGKACDTGQADHAPPPLVQLGGRGADQGSWTRSRGKGEETIVAEEDVEVLLNQAPLLRASGPLLQVGRGRVSKC